MKERRLPQFVNLVAQVRNPIGIILDRLGLIHSPYRLRLRDGLVIELRPGYGDRFAFYETVLRKTYFSAGQQLRWGETVIDVGANIGCFSLLAAQLVGPAGRVIAVEPNRTSFAQLRHNIALNFVDNVEPLCLALGSARGKAILHRGGNALFSSIYGEVDGKTVQGGEQEVEMSTLDAIMSQRRVDRCHYLKLDCEGAEYDILRTVSPELARRIDQITMEIHQVTGHSVAEIGSTLEGLGFSFVEGSNPACFRRET